MIVSPSLRYPDVRQQVAYIYALLDPLDRVRYVGKASDLRGRFRAHRARKGASRAVRRWLDGLRACDFAPAIRVLRIVHPGEDIARWEAHFIALYAQSGLLLNVHVTPVTQHRNRGKSQG